MTSSDKTKWKNYLRTVSVKLFQSVLFVSPSWSSSLSSSVKSQESRESLSRGTNDQWYCSTSLSLPSSQQELFLSSLLINHESIRCTEQHFNSCLMFPVETFNDSCWSTSHDHTQEMITAPELRRDWAQCSVISSDADCCGVGGGNNHNNTTTPAKIFHSLPRFMFQCNVTVNEEGRICPVLCHLKSRAICLTKKGMLWSWCWVGFNV